MIRITCAIIIASFATLPAIGQVPQAPQPPAAPLELPEGPGKAPFLRVCSNCHGVESIVHGTRTRQEWTDVVDQMARFGAEASDQEFEQITAYLVRFYSPVRVNRATAKELESWLGLTPEMAAAIVSYREANGPFKDLDGLKHVPGLDWPKIESQKARIQFVTP